MPCNFSEPFFHTVETGIKKTRFYSILYILSFPGPVLSVNVGPEKLNKKIQREMKITIQYY